MQLLDSFDFPASETTAALTVQRWAVPAGQEWATIAALQNDPSIAYAEPNWLVQAADLDQSFATIPPPNTEIPYVPTDTLYENNQWYLQRINASRAWSIIYNSGLVSQLSPVSIAVIDSGIDFSHPEFAGRLQPGFNFINNTADPNLTNCTLPNVQLDAPVDDFGHGTHVTGLLAAGLNNGSGIASLSPFVTVHPLRVLNNAGSGSVADVALAIRYAALCLNVEIINLSLEVPASTILGNSSLNQTFQSAVSLADSRGILQIAAGGNRAANLVPFPAAYPEVMGVSALNYDNKKASYSTTGDGIDLAAPGGEIQLSAPRIYSTWSIEAASKCASNYRVIGGGAYCNDAGTSMSAPLVASVAALIWAIRPELTHNQVAGILTETATPLGLPATQVGAGRVDAYAAVRRVLRPRFVYSEPSFNLELAGGTAPFMLNLRVESDSLETMSWRANVPTTTTWLKLSDAVSGTRVGSIRFGEPIFFTLAVSPTALSSGTYIAEMTLSGTSPSSGRFTETVAVNLAINTAFKKVFLPLVAKGTTNSPPTPPIVRNNFGWETPIRNEDRTSYSLLDDSNIGVSLPPTFTFPMRGNNYTDLRIFSDGFITFPSSETGVTKPNRCLPDVSAPEQAIYGWWSDLDPNTTGSRVSTFQPGNDRFVIEFSNVTSTSTPTYTVSFQIVLYNNGNIALNYLTLPSFVGTPLPATVGIESRDGLFALLIACSTPASSGNRQVIGVLPQSEQSFLIKASDLF